MNRTILILLSTSLFSGCCIFVPDGGFCRDSISSAVCGGTAVGYTATVVAYGESSLIVVPVSKIKEDTEWRFILRPLGNNAALENATVTISGKTTPGNNAWIDTAGTGPGDAIQGSFSADGTLAACVKPPVSTPAQYWYIVNVEGVGTLDPRADIEE